MPEFSLGDLLRCVGLLSIAFGCVAIAARDPYSEWMMLAYLVLPFLGAGIGALYKKALAGFGLGFMAQFVAILVMAPFAIQT